MAAVIVGANRYRVRWRDMRRKSATGLAGRTNNRKHIIEIATDQSPAEQRDTLLHETLHAIIYTSAANELLDMNEASEEKLIRLLTPWLLQVLRDNPELVECLTSKVG